jgi:hypothetical protein
VQRRSGRENSTDIPKDASTDIIEELEKDGSVERYGEIDVDGTYHWIAFEGDPTD